MVGDDKAGAFHEVAPSLFRVRWPVVNERLLTVAEERGHVGTLDDALARPGLGAFRLDELHPPTDDSPGQHFGAKTRLFWTFVYDVFVGGGGAVAHPQRAAAKSVLGADIYSKPIAWGGTAYISVWAESPSGEPGEPSLVPFPRVPDVLMKRMPDASFGDSARAYRWLIAETVDRVNMIWPVALVLARSQIPAG